MTNVSIINIIPIIVGLVENNVIKGNFVIMASVNSFVQVGSYYVIIVVLM